MMHALWVRHRERVHPSLCVKSRPPRLCVHVHVMRACMSLCPRPQLPPILAMAKESGRVLLTRDHRLAGSRLALEVGVWVCVCRKGGGR
jgi:hypothetical protein